MLIGLGKLEQDSKFDYHSSRLLHGPELHKCQTVQIKRYNKELNPHSYILNWLPSKHELKCLEM